MTAGTTPRLLRAALFASIVAGVLLVASNFSPIPPALADTPTAHGTCSPGIGVTVVADFSDVGGTVEVGCTSDDPKTGRAALVAAGFTATDSTAGLICAIDAKPDPCPATFEGSYWSYWHAKPGEAWVSYQVGADSSKPVRGEVEGWRYNDGSAGPSISALVAVNEAAPAETHSSSPTPQTTANADGTRVVSVVAGAALILLIIAAIVLMARRNAASHPAKPDDHHGHGESD